VKVIDVHSHLGFDYVFQEDFRPEYLIEELEGQGVDTLITQPATVLDLATAREQHDAVAALAKRFPGRIYGMANPSPHLPEDVYRAEVERCVRELGFVGIKLNTTAHSVGVGLRPGRLVFQVARELKVPVMVHTGSGVPWALPSALLPVAREFDDVKIVMAHSGAMIYAAEALEVAINRPNVYLEVSWTPGHLVRKFCRAVGARRVMFGTDHADNCATELVKLRTAGLSDEELEWCLGRTAAEVYSLPC